MSIKLNVNTDQDAFDAVVRHLRAQNRQASWDGACAYRTPAGTKCAIGALIDDDEYMDGIEGISIRELIWSEIVLTDITPTLLAELQSLHDWSDTWSNKEKLAWVSNFGIDRLRNIAQRYGLDDSVIDAEFRWVTGNEISGLRS